MRPYSLSSFVGLAWVCYFWVYVCVELRIVDVLFRTELFVLVGGCDLCVTFFRIFLYSLKSNILIRLITLNSANINLISSCNE